ncbi:MAG TPA: SDR family oxidoreductase [Bryobacteraceae bacterium]|nr:SDR family oxidoreductase [Bryobacteraceae bacterium]
MPRPLNEQVVVISGAGSGIGRATARRFARQGARLVIGGRSSEGLAAIREEVQEAGGPGVAILEVDVSRRDQVERLAQFAVETYGRIDTWVNNAGVSIYARFDTLPEDEARRLFDVNFWGTVYGMWAAAAVMRPQGGGTIINLASVVGKRALPLQNFYSASKFAIVGISEALRVEWRTERANIQVCAICPPSIDTPFYDNALTRMGFTPKPLPVVLPAERVAKDIVRCAVRPRREVWVGWVGKAFVGLSVLLPGMMDRFILSLGFQAQLTGETKSPADPADLFQPTAATSVEGDWSAWGNRRGAGG